MPQAGIRLEFIVAPHHDLDGHGPLPCCVEQVERLMPDRPFAYGKELAAGEDAQTGQDRKCPFHRVQPASSSKRRRWYVGRAPPWFGVGELNLGKLRDVSIDG